MADMGEGVHLFNVVEVVEVMKANLSALTAEVEVLKAELKSLKAVEHEEPPSRIDRVMEAWAKMDSKGGQ